jgi:hypothetical protein
MGLGDHVWGFQKQIKRISSSLVKKEWPTQTRFQQE